MVFLGGTHFNRCKQIHPLFVAALKSLYFHEFHASSDDADVTTEELKLMLTGKTDEEIRSMILNNDPSSIFHLFQRYKILNRRH